MPTKYQVYKDVEGNFRFRLCGGNNEILAMSQAYEQHSSCMKGLLSVQRNCSSEIEDMTLEGARSVIPNPKYQVFCDQKGRYRFHLNASNGEMIVVSEGYETKEVCLNGIRLVRNSFYAEVEDLTYDKASIESAAEKKTPEPTEVKTAIPLVNVQDSTDAKSLKPVEAPSLAVEQTSEGIAPSAYLPKNGVGETDDRSIIVFVGNKMPMDYVLAIITGLSAGVGKKVVLKARGKSITTAVDAAEIAKNRFLKGLKVSNIVIGTEEMPPREGDKRARMVSTIEIVLTKT